MSYSPPSVQTVVQVSNGGSISLPAGTRVLSLIGQSNSYKSISAEQQTQSSAYTFNTNLSGVTNVLSVYDYSGPGNSQFNYSSSGVGAFGSGYFVSGNNTIAFTTAANKYPVSTTPASGATFLVNYNYSGSTLSGTSVLESDNFSFNYITTSGSQSVALDIPYNSSIIAIYSGSTTASGLYPLSGNASTSGTGWYQSGNSAVFTNGVLPNWASGVNHGWLPASGANFYINYTYSGSNVVSLTQLGTYTEAIPQPFTSGISVVSSIAAVSGTTGYLYYSSGTAANPDSSGYSTSGSGYSLSGSSLVPTPSQYISWSAVNPSTYTYPSGLVPQPGDVLYINYQYAKYGNDYSPLTFTSYPAVINQEGNEANWVLVTSGTNAGNYQLVNYNPLTIGALVAFNNRAPLIQLTQISGVGNQAGAFLNTLALLQSQIVDVIVPLTVGSGISPYEMNVTQKALALEYTSLHCQTMSNQFNELERVALGSLGPSADIGNASTPNTYISTAIALNSPRISLVAPGITFIQLQDPSGQYQTIAIDGAYLAVAAGALSCNPASDVATPLTNQSFDGFTDISAITLTGGHPSQYYMTVEKNNLAANGVFVIDKSGPDIYVRQQLTTSQSGNIINEEFSVVTLIDYVSQSARYTTDQFIGKKLVPALVISAVTSTISATMSTLLADNIIGKVGAITVTINPNNATQLLSQVSYVPIFPLNQIIITFNITTSLTGA